jgi:hypothetical protein
MVKGQLHALAASSLPPPTPGKILVSVEKEAGWARLLFLDVLENK